MKTTSIRHKKMFTEGCLFLFLVYGCGNTQSSPPPPPSKKATKEVTPETQTDPNSSAGPNEQALAKSDFAGWCSEASLTKVTQAAPLKDHFAKLCDGGNPTSLLSSSLLKTAFAGSGAPNLSYIEEISSDTTQKTTTAYFGVAIKIPTDMKTYNAEVAPILGTEAVVREMTAAQKATQKSVTITKRTITDKYWVRGWNVRSETSMLTGGINITTDSIQAQDQYELKADSLYLFTNQTTTSTKTIKSLSMVTAGLDIESSGYLITVVHLVVDNLGLADVAETTIQDTAKSMVIAMYKIAEKGKSSVATP